ncbi:hypothetical protein PHYSODRAFT_481539 [Phytophthora sojae]|uniref:DUF4200 domain-containing protein n=1 Tax=Phytophthora sojae (strain P6497) TaxID=1094619 RepID=G4YTV5_PHYSP|nr:hypothetical protein PHYSODRAFT_481539 [Phytophthora sojae]EGZ24841.1 hypothetical protein PHYSODRAFT_481539 [Phytophthora sojae]|eukprot:XP_009520129.1 hypothetical protein PHYSODRAFT_481539 [Phytophthora sojae]
MPSLGAIIAPPRRPKSAGAFPSANRKLMLAAAAAPENSPRLRMPISHRHSIQQRRPQLSRFPRPPSASGSTSPRPRPCSAAVQLWRQPGTPIASSHNAIVQRVVREEIDEQRHVTLDAQRQLHELQATIARRQEELELAQRHLQAFDTPKVQPTPSEVASSLKEEIAHQDAYKKRLKYMHERLLQQVRYLEANADLLAERRRATHRERSLCRSRAKLEADKSRQIRQQLRELHGKQAAFKRNALPVLESYRDELASRLVITQRRQDADRRRDELIRFIGSRSTAASKVSTRSLTSATAAISRQRAPSGRMQRRDSYNILVADADENKRETLFAVYEGQYARVLRETGEADLSMVLERFQSYRESTARLREIESELRAEGARLAGEQQARSAMVARLRVSGPTDVAERRQRLRDRLEGALHAQQLEKNQARERVNAQLKAFVYAQQGVLHIVELLQCLEDRSAVALTPPPPVLAIARTVMGGNQPAEVALKIVAPALQTLVHLAREVARRGLQREWFKLPPLGYSVPQVARLEQFAPEGQVQRGPFDLDAEYEDLGGAKDRKLPSDRPEEEVDEEKRDATIMRRAIKRQEKDTLRQAETILCQTQDARRLLQLQQQQQQDQQRKPQSPRIKVHQESDVEIVAAHFREQRRAERQEHRFMNGSVLCTGNRRAVSSNTAIVPPAAQSPRRRHPC